MVIRTKNLNRHTEKVARQMKILTRPLTHNKYVLSMSVGKQTDDSDRDELFAYVYTFEYCEAMRGHKIQTE